MATAQLWLAGARPRTLPVAVAPVLVGTGAAVPLLRQDAVSWGLTQLGQALLALLVALALQVAVNYANDYSDGVRGTDDVRVGPMRLTASGAAPAAAVRTAAFSAFAVAALAGLILVAWSGQWWLIAVGAACVLAAWYYTGGARPCGYAGLGELSVFVFFGLVAVLGTTYTQAGRVDLAAVLGAVGIGALACAVLVANNLRDVPTDQVAGKRTLAVRLGEARTRILFAGLVTAPVPATVLTAAATARPWTVLALLAAPLAWAPLRRVLRGSTGTELLPVLKDTGRLELVFAALLMLGLVL